MTTKKEKKGSTNSAQREAERVKKLREKRRREKREGRTSERRLAWLDKIISSSGYNHKTFAEAAGMTPQAVHWIFAVADDCTLSKAESMLAAIGLSLKARIAPVKGRKSKVKTINRTWNYKGVIMEVSGNIGVVTTKVNNYPYPEYIVNYPQDGRLAWLVNYIKDQGLSMRRFAMTYGLDSIQLRYWIINDDIRISQIHLIADAIQHTIIWTF